MHRQCPRHEESGCENYAIYSSEKPKDRLQSRLFYPQICDSASLTMMSAHYFRPLSSRIQPLTHVLERPTNEILLLSVLSEMGSVVCGVMKRVSEISRKRGYGFRRTTQCLGRGEACVD